MGLPAILTSVAPNQVPLARAMAAHGAGVNSGPIELADTASLESLVASVAADPARRRAMSFCGPALVDGRGSHRVVARMLGHLLHLRTATPEDCRLYWEWANDPQVRASSFSARPIPWNEHRVWFGERLADPTSHLYVAADGAGRNVGQVRFDVEMDTAIADVSVAPEHRGRGWGAALIDAGSRRLFKESSVVTIEARVKSDNPASTSAFDDAGFALEAQGSSGTTTWLRYAYSRDAIHH